MSDEPVPFHASVEPFADHAFVEHVSKLPEDQALRAMVELEQLKERLSKDPKSLAPEFSDRNGELFGHDQLGDSPMYVRYRIDPATRTAKVYDVGRVERDHAEDMLAQRPRDPRDLERWHREMDAARMPEREFEQHHEQLRAKRDMGTLSKDERLDLDVANLDASHRRMAKTRERQHERTHERGHERERGR